MSSGVQRANGRRPRASNARGSGVQRSGDALGDCLIGCPLPNSSIEQWRMVVIVTGYTLFVTSQYYVIFTLQTKVCRHNLYIQGRQSSGREAVSSPRGLFGAYSLRTKLQDQQDLIMKHYKSMEFLPNFRIVAAQN